MKPLVVGEYSSLFSVYFFSMTKRLNIDQKLQQIFLVLLGVVDGVTPNKDAYETIVKIINDVKLCK